MRERIKKTAAVFICIILAGMAAAFVIKLTGKGIPCIFYKTTGLKCAGCGNTTAVLALLELDFKGALEANLCMPLEFGYLLTVAVLTAVKYIRTGESSLELPPMWLNIIMMIIMTAWVIVRNIT